MLRKVLFCDSNWTQWLWVNVGLSNGFVPSDNKPLPESKVNPYLCHHMASVGHNMLICNNQVFLIIFHLSHSCLFGPKTFLWCYIDKTFNSKLKWDIFLLHWKQWVKMRLIFVTRDCYYNKLWSKLSWQKLASWQFSIFGINVDIGHSQKWEHYSWAPNMIYVIPISTA